ncbi:MAG: hypothetical protein HC880_10425 [Bacteroidia bacterium]|nr:hypothetical protein [Bacteroidia bacterium]
MYSKESQMDSISTSSSTRERDILRIVNLDTAKYKKCRIYLQSKVDQIFYDYWLEKHYIQTDLKKGILFYFKRLPVFIFYDAYSQNDFILNVDNELLQRNPNQLMPSSFYKDKLSYANIEQGYIKLKVQAQSKKSLVKTILTNEIAIFKDNKKDFILINYLNINHILVLNFVPDKLFNNVYENNTEYVDSWINIFNEDIGLSNLKYEDHLYFKLPEYGTTLLACPDERDFIEDPEAFWQDKLQNAPQKIIRLKWQDGKFVIEPPESKRPSGGE